MKRLLTFAFIIANTFLIPESAPARPQEAAQPVIKGGTEEVLLDVVVRDKKGRPINDLKPGDFEILDNGAKHEIKSFRLVEGTQATTNSGAKAQLDPLQQIRLVSLVFEVGDPSARKLSRDAALDLLKNEIPPNVYFAIFAIDHQLEAIQQFTNDRDKLRQGIERATHGQGADYAADSARVREQLEQELGPNSSGAQSLQERVNNMPTGATATTGPGAAPDGGMIAQKLMAQIMLNALQYEQSMATVEKGRGDIFSLLSLVKEQYRLPGRKTVVYFSEGFAIPQGMEQPFQNVISIANRSNVSFYAVDARGLGLGNQNQAAIDALNSAAKSSKDQATSTGYEAVRPDQANVFDTAIGSTRANVQVTLGILANSTGGFLVANTNDFRGPLKRLADDIETYYEISYDPQIEKYDGTFRKISVKVDRADAKVQSRSGYFALPAAVNRTGGVTHAFEVPLLQALGSSPLPHQFAYKSEGLHFRGPQNEPTAAIAMDVPIADITLTEDKAANVFQGRLSYVALVKNAQGEVVKKFENEIPVKAPPDKVAGLKGGHFIYTDFFDAPPGRYTLESAVLDQEGSKVSARKTSFMVPPAAALGISSVSMVHSMKSAGADESPNDPMLMEGRVVSPAVNPVLKKAETQNLSFYLVVYADKGNTTLPKLGMEFSKDGKVLGSGHPDLGKPDGSGRIQYVATVPAAQLEPGNYRIRFVVQQGTEAAEESATFQLE